MLKYYLLLAFRNLMHNKFQSLFSIVGLAVAFYCFGFFAYFVHGYVSYDEYYDKHDRVLVLCNDNGKYVDQHVSEYQIRDLQQRFPEVEAVFRYLIDYSISLERADGGLSDTFRFIDCDTTLQHIYEPTLLAGNWETAKAADYSIVLCQTRARQLFGSEEQAIGQQFYGTPNMDRKPVGSQKDYRFKNLLGETVVYNVRAVVEDLPYNAEFFPFSSNREKLDGWLLNCRVKDIHRAEQSGIEDFYFLVPKYDFLQDTYYVRILLREGTDIDDFCQRLKDAQISSQTAIDHTSSKFLHMEGVQLRANRIEPFHMNSRESFWVFMAILLLPGVVILLSALSNFFHLLLSNILMRRREYTLRRAHGAHTFDLWCMVSTQVIVSLLLVGACTLLIVKICNPWLQVGSFTPETEVMLGHTCQHLGLLLALGLLIAWMAVARIRKDSLQESMKTTTGQKPNRHIARNILLGWQLTVGLFFLSVLMAFFLQIRVNDSLILPQLTQAEKDEIITAPLYFSADVNPTEPLDYTLLREYQEALKAIPCIQNVSLGDGIFSNSTQSVTLNDETDTITTYHMSLSPELIQMLKVNLQEGQWPQNPEDGIVIDRNFAQNHEVGVGDHLRILNYRQSYVITGIIDNLYENTTIVTPNRNKKEDCCYIIYPDLSPVGYFTCRSYPGQADQMRQAINRMFKEKFAIPEYANLQLPSLRDKSKQRNDLHEVMPIIRIMAYIALFLALLGIYSSIAADTTSRRKEMAIRKINGAKAYHIALRFCRLYGILLAVAMALAFPILYILIDWFKGQSTFRVFFDYGPLFWLGNAVLMLLLIALAIGWQVWTISRIQPAEVVKTE